MLDYIYLRSAKRQHISVLPSWVPDWADLDDELGGKTFDYIRSIRSHLNEKQTAIIQQASGNLNVKISGDKLEAKGVHMSTVASISNLLTTPQLTTEKGDKISMSRQGQACIGDMIVCLDGCVLPLLLRGAGEDCYRIVSHVEDNALNSEFQGKIYKMRYKTSSTRLGPYRFKKTRTFRIM